MTRMTMYIIQTRDDINVSSYGEKGEYGFLIEVGEFHRLLLNSNRTYISHTEATEAGLELISEIRAFEEFE